MSDLVNELFEATQKQMKRKQASIHKLFPQFNARVGKIPPMGGLHLQSADKTTWVFKIHSGTKKSVWYENVIMFKDMESTVKSAVADKKNWNKTKTHADLRKVARYIFDKSDIQYRCSCPADLYYGGHYIRSQDKYDSMYGSKENRPPKVRNPKQYGAHCKHYQNLVRALPFYADTMASILKRDYVDVIVKAESSFLENKTKKKAK